MIKINLITKSTLIVGFYTLMVLLTLLIGHTVIFFKMLDTDISFGKNEHVLTVAEARQYVKNPDGNHDYTYGAEYTITRTKTFFSWNRVVDTTRNYIITEVK